MIQNILNMNNGILLLLIIFLHIYADFNMQGIMAEMKQKDWWKKYPKKYQYDYVMPLIGHAFQWSFFVHLPVTIYAVLSNISTLEFYACASIVFHTIIHAWIDTKKANDHTTTLIRDQFFHMLQLIAIWAIFCWIK